MVQLFIVFTVDFTSFLVFAQTSFAGSSACLSQASNQDLMREMSQRLNYSPANPDQGAVSTTFTCAGNAEIIIDSISTLNGQSAQIKVASGDWSACRNYVEVLNNKIGSGNSSGKIFAICGGNAELSKFTVIQNGRVIQSSKTATGDWANCRSSADQINSKR